MAESLVIRLIFPGGFYEGKWASSSQRGLDRKILNLGRTLISQRASAVVMHFKVIQGR